MFSIEIPDSVYKPSHTLNSGISKVPSSIKGPQKHQVGSKGIGPKLFDIFIRNHNVTLGFAHLCPFFDKQAVRIKSGKGLFEVNEAEISKNHGQKARVKKMKNRVLGSPDIHVHRKPFFAYFRIPGGILDSYAWITKVIPSAI